MMLGDALAAGLQTFAAFDFTPDAADIARMRPIVIGLNLAFVLVGAAMAWRIRKGPARWPIVALLVWLVIETLGKATGLRPLGAVTDVAFLFVAGRAPAAAQARHAGRRAAAGRPVDPTVF